MSTIRCAEAILGHAPEVGDRLLEAADRPRGGERGAARMPAQVVAVALHDEVVQGLPGDEDHAASSPLPRWISVVGTSTRRVGRRSPSSRANSSSAVSRPS